jgi:hypothetical protein
MAPDVDFVPIPSGALVSSHEVFRLTFCEVSEKPRIFGPPHGLDRRRHAIFAAGGDQKIQEIPGAALERGPGLKGKGLPA